MFLNFGEEENEKMKIILEMFLLLRVKVMKNVHNAFRFQAGPISSATKPMPHG
jgi:hypothetical protein